MSNYLYNGVELPDINEVWTDELKKQYPYAAIRRAYVSSVYYYLYIAAAPFYVTKEYYPISNITEWYISGLLNCKVWKIVNYEQPPNVWEMAWDEFPYDRQAITSNSCLGDSPIVWCNHAIYDSTNNQLWIAASEPIPVGGEPIDPTSLLMGYRVGQMIRGMRNKPKEEA